MIEVIAVLMLFGIVAAVVYDFVPFFNTWLSVF